ncbi:MAG: methyltransferase domain-containing protein [Syntrophobacterales bacterium]|nr:methyltransferase domain-containing protein [Syntrophobacterales bacterium]
MPPRFAELMEIATRFRPARILMTAVELGLFDHLEEPCTPADLAARVGADARALEILLNALTAMGVVVKTGEGGFQNGEAASAFLVRGTDNYRGAIIRHLAHTWLGWTELTETVIRGRASEQKAEKWLDRHPVREEAWMRDFIWGMHALARDLAPEVAAKLDFTGVRRLLDLGGGPGTYAIAFAQAVPELTAVVFDLPGPAEIARENIARHGLSHRVTVQPGNFLTDDLGRDYDFIWISQILHSHSEAQCRGLLAKAVAALTPGGRVAIQDFFLHDDGCTPAEAAFFSVHMLAVTPEGRSYRYREVMEWLEGLGLTSLRQFATGPQTSVVQALKP